MKRRVRVVAALVESAERRGAYLVQQRLSMPTTVS